MGIYKLFNNTNNTRKTTMKTKLLSVLNALLANDPFEEVGNVSFSLTEPQQGRVPLGD
jgi:hypothetical protein